MCTQSGSPEIYRATTYRTKGRNWQKHSHSREPRYSIHSSRSIIQTENQYRNIGLKWHIRSNGHSWHLQSLSSQNIGLHTLLWRTWNSLKARPQVVTDLASCFFISWFPFASGLEHWWQFRVLPLPPTVHVLIARSYCLIFPKHPLFSDFTVPVLVQAAFILSWISSYLYLAHCWFDCSAS